MNQTISRWECDRCHTIQQSTTATWQPSTWVTVWVTNPPLGTPGEAYTEKTQLCQECHHALRDWLDSGAVVGEHADGPDG